MMRRRTRFLLDDGNNSDVGVLIIHKGEKRRRKHTRHKCSRSDGGNDVFPYHRGIRQKVGERKIEKKSAWSTGQESVPDIRSDGTPPASRPHAAS